MKILVNIVVMSFMCIVPFQAMQTGPLTPVKAKKESELAAASPKRGCKRSLELAGKENFSEETELVPAPLQPSLAEVVTPKGKALRSKIAAGVKRCVAMPFDDIFEDGYTPVEDEHDPLLTYSPQSLTKTLHAQALDVIRKESQEYGVSQEQVRAMLPAACRSVAASALKRIAQLTEPSLPDQENFKKLAAYFNEPSFVLRFNTSTDLADNLGSSVVANKAAMDELTPLEQTAVYAHEITHGKHKDVEYRQAYSDAFKVLGKHEAYKDFSEILFRTQEVFADLSPASKSSDLASGLAQFRQARLKKYGPGKPSTHPARDAWAELDAAMVELHAKHTQEKERRARLSQAAKRFLHRLENEPGSK